MDVGRRVAPDNPSCYVSAMASAVLAVFLAGIFVATFGFPFSMLAWAAVFCAACAGLFVRSRRRLLVLVVVVLIFAGGMFRYGIADRPTAVQSHAGSEAAISGYVDGDFELTSSGGRFYLRATSVDGIVVAERVLVLTRAWPRYERGQFLRVTGRLEYPVNSGDFDYVSYLKKEGVRMLARYPDMDESGPVLMPVSERMRYRTFLYLNRVRDAMADGVRTAVPEPSAAYLNGILLGMRSDIPDDLAGAFAATGTTHVLAISGYNITIVAQGLLLALLYVLDRRKAVWVAVAGIAAFALLTGASASVVRAAIMGSLVLVAQAFGSRLKPLPLIIGAAALMAAYNPYVLRYDVGFQLSFAAVAGLIYLTPVMELWIPVRALGRNFAGMLHATLAAQIATLPLILYHFGTLSVYALPANVVILPLIPYAMALGAVAGIGAFVAPVVGPVLGYPALAVSGAQLAAIRSFAVLPGASVSIPLSWATAVVCYALLVVIARQSGLRHTQRERGVA